MQLQPRHIEVRAYLPVKELDSAPGRGRVCSMALTFGFKVIFLVVVHHLEGPAAVARALAECG